MKRNYTLIALVFIASAAFVSGCASMNSGTTQQIKINSNPPGATVYTALKSTKDNKPVILKKVAVGVTPLTVTLSRKDGAVFLEKEGFEPTEISLTTKMNPWVWGDILLGSLLSTSIDSSTGASNEYDPGEYVIDLKPQSK